MLKDFQSIGETKPVIKFESMVGSSSGDRFSERIPAPNTLIKIESNVSTISSINGQVIDERKKQNMKHSSSSGRPFEIKKAKYTTKVQCGPEEGTSLAYCLDPLNHTHFSILHNR